MRDKVLSLISGLLGKEEKTIPENEDDLFERSWQHAKDSLQNVQSIIQFVDAKSGLLAAFMSVATAGVAAAPFWLLSLDDGHSGSIKTLLTNNDCLGFGAAIYWAVCFFAGTLAVLCALLSILARQPNHVDAFSQHTTQEVTEGLPKAVILVPVSTLKNISETHKVLDRLSNGLTHKYVLSEYKRQLLVTGAILGDKIKWHRRAVWFLIGHIILATIGTIICGFWIFLNY